MSTRTVRVTREEMERILNEHCPTASPLVRNAALTGSPLTIDGVRYQAPDTFDPTKDQLGRIPATIVKVGKTWINN